MLVLALLILLVVALIAAYFYRNGNGEVSYFSIEKDEDLTSLEAGFVITVTVLFLFILFVLLVKLW